MPLFYASLNSGSNGNCYYIGNDREAVLIDAGISYKETLKRLQSLRIPVDRIKAVFITHEHIDHIKGAELVSKRFDIPVYATEKTWRHGGMAVPSHLRTTIGHFESVSIGNLTIKGFPKKHDAADPVSFIVSDDIHTVGVFTDIGEPCEHVEFHFGKCHAAFLEANYDEQMLEQGPYPFYLKQRIKGPEGHLSNCQARKVFKNHRASFMSHILLSHLSKENNNPELALKSFTQDSGQITVDVASRYGVSPLYQTGHPGNKKAAPVTMMQLDLFGQS